MTPDSPFRLLVEQRLPHGHLAAVGLPPHAHAHAHAHAEGDPSHDMAAEGARLLLPDEQRLADSLALPRRISFVGGRVALRHALRAVSPSAPPQPILRTHRGAPDMPHGVLGSVSHKRRLAVALVTTPSPTVQTLGVDLEEVPDERDLARRDLAPKILTANERHLLAPLAAAHPLAYREAVRLRFALKEAVYKTIDPHVQRYVRFQEVEVFPQEDGTTQVVLALPEFADGRLTVTAWWMRLGDHLVATAIGSPIDAPPGA